MGFEGQVWRVRSGEEPVGEIVLDEAGFPWLNGVFTPASGFAAVRDLFARELVLMDEEDWEGADLVYEEIRRRITLTSPEGPVAEFLLHIEGDRAWFRWSDEPFEEDGGAGRVVAEVG
ncbi:hypothetical protein FSY75_15600 [Streptomyces sp. TR1341]|uniref:hypothetical protein n=1 Tax=Streptomyces sp. TR1341 TaxID=2601266 RepID=UPI00138B0E44|nr:hypothetical protein [Streptomyces sp. TR1341]